MPNEHAIPSSEATSLADVKGAIIALLDDTPAEVRAAVARVAASHAEALAGEFYRVMLDDSAAANYLAHDLVSRRLKASMQAWLELLFVDLVPDRVEYLVARQIEVGEVHARIRLPLTLMQAGTRVLCEGLRRRVLATRMSSEHQLRAQVYVGDLMYLAEGVMLNAYIRDVRKGAQALEAYRHLAMTHDTVLERERQRAALSEWASEILFAAHSPGRLKRVPRLAESDFGLWFNHKAQMLFDGASDIGIVADAMEQIDSVLIPKLGSGGLVDSAGEPVLHELRRQLEFVRYLVGDLFDRLSSASSGKDVVTGLLARRHLATVIERTSIDHARRGQAFALVLAHIDEHRAAVADTESRNALLHQFAGILLETSRSSDHLFRYGENDFLIVAVESSEALAREIAERLRNRVFAHRFVLRHNPGTRISVSVGVAVHDGHPDYANLLSRVEGAAIAAVSEGGNRVAVG